MAEVDQPPQVPLLHRIYRGSPFKFRTPKRLFQSASTKKTLVHKARKVEKKEGLCSGEVFITHTKTINTNSECLLPLAKVGVSERALVSEALLVLVEEVDQHFQSLFNMVEYSHDASQILGSVRVKKGFRFHAFAYGIHQVCKRKDENGLVYAAVRRSGVTLFWQVLADAAEENTENQSLQWMAYCDPDSEFDILHTWSSLFDYIQQRNKVSHPFSFIGGYVQLAKDALEVLKFLIQQEGSHSKYGGILHLMKATVPMFTTKVSKKKLKEMKLKKKAPSEDQLAR